MIRYTQAQHKCIKANPKVRLKEKPQRRNTPVISLSIETSPRPPEANGEMQACVQQATPGVHLAVSVSPTRNYIYNFQWKPINRGHTVPIAPSKTNISYNHLQWSPDCLEVALWSSSFPISEPGGGLTRVWLAVNKCRSSQLPSSCGMGAEYMPSVTSW